MLQRYGLDRVANGRRGAVRVHVADVVRSNLGVFDRRHRRTDTAVAVLRRLRDVVRVAGHSVARDFRDDVCAAPLRKFQRFQNQHARAFAHHKTVALGIKRTAGALGFIVARGKRAHRGESADAHRRHGRFRTARDHHFRVAALNNFERVAHCVRRAEQAVAVAEFGPFAP